MFESVESFVLDSEPTEDQREFVSELNVILNKIGCSIDFSTHKSDFSDKVYHFLKLKINSETAKKSLRRDAGRKKIFLQDKNGNFVKVKELREKMKEQDVYEVAAHYGVSRATLFRRLKEARSDDSWV